MLFWGPMSALGARLIERALGLRSGGALGFSVARLWVRSSGSWGFWGNFVRVQGLPASLQGHYKLHDRLGFRVLGSRV